MRKWLMRVGTVAVLVLLVIMLLAPVMLSFDDGLVPVILSPDESKP